MVSTSTQAKQSDSKAAESYIVQQGSSGLELARLIRDRLELTISQEAKSSAGEMSGNLSGWQSLGPRFAGYCGI